MTDPMSGPSKAMTGIAASLPILLALVSCCVVPLVAAFDPAHLDRFAQEMGWAFYAVIAMGALCAFVCSMLLFLSARGKRVPVAILLFFAGLPWLVGLAGASYGVHIASSAVTFADPASRAALMAQGISEATNARLFGAWIGAGLLASVGLGLASSALGQRAPERRAVGALLGVAAAMPILGLVGFAFVGGIGEQALWLLLPALGMILVAGVAAAAAGEDAPRHRSLALAAAAPLGLGLAFVATVEVVQSTATIRVFGAIASTDAASKAALMAHAAEEMGALRLVGTWGMLVVLLPAVAVALWTLGRARPSGGRLAGALFALLVAALLPLAGASVSASTAEALARAGAAPWADTPDFEPVALGERALGSSSVAAMVLPDRLVPPGEAAILLSDRAAMAALFERHLRGAAPSALDPFGSGGGGSVAVAPDRRLDAPALRALVDAATAAGAEALILVGTVGEPLTERERSAIRDNAPIFAVVGDALGAASIALPTPSVVAGAPFERPAYLGVVGAQATTRLEPFPDGAAPGIDLAEGEAADHFGGERAFLIVGDDAIAASLMTAASRAARRGLEPVALITPARGDAAQVRAAALEALGALGWAVADPDPPEEASAVPNAGARAVPTAGILGRLGGAQQDRAEPAVLGSLGRDVIQRVVRSHLAQVRQCYERVLVRDPRLAGTVRVRFVIGPDGRVQSADADGSDIGSRTVEQCVTRVVRGWRFPAPEGGGVVVVTYPFLFQQG